MGYQWNYPIRKRNVDMEDRYPSYNKSTQRSRSCTELSGSTIQQLNNSALANLKAIGITNLFYCALIIGIVINYNSSLTALGIAYFLLEVLII